jgi:prepilin-type N-terminal cleavage/methylation domain-containing protein
MRSTIHHPRSTIHAFTLIELAIVLTVIGLLVGGIVLGQALLGTSAIRASISDIQRIETAVTGFQTKYEALPGDFKIATSYWGTDADGCPTHTNRVQKTATCNGDGNGQLGNSNPELFRAWQHLASSAFYAGSFTGVTDSGGTIDANIGANVPPATVEGGGFAFAPYLGNGYAGDADRYAGDYGNATLVYGKEDGTNSLESAVLTPTDTLNIDTKIDNGLPGSGRMMVRIGTCSSDARTYTQTTTAIACNILFKLTD